MTRNSLSNLPNALSTFIGRERETGEVLRLLASHRLVTLIGPGGPSPGFHFPNDIAPGASFCNSQSQAPGFHVP